MYELSALLFKQRVFIYSMRLVLILIDEEFIDIVDSKSGSWKCSCLSRFKILAVILLIGLVL